MKLRNKEINIFSMSALDLFASALGAFMLLTIAALPFFPNTGDSPGLVDDLQQEMGAELDALQDQLDTANDLLTQTQIELAQCQAQTPAPDGDILTQTQTELEACQAQLNITFAMVVISWPSEDDVDLHIIDPMGNEYYYAERTFPGSDAALAEDNVRGPGNEIWLSPQAMQGDYEMYVYMFSKNSPGAVSVTGSILHRDGRITLPDTTLNTSGEMPLVTRFNVDAQGNVSLL